MSYVIDINFKGPVGFVYSVELDCALQPVGAGEGWEGQVLAVGGVAIHSLENDFDLIIVTHCGAGGDYPSNSQLCGAMLDYG